MNLEELLAQIALCEDSARRFKRIATHSEGRRFYWDGPQLSMHEL
jgi:hypothetical protein